MILCALPLLSWNFFIILLVLLIVAIGALNVFAGKNDPPVTLQMAKEGKPEEKDREIEIPNKLPAPSNTSNAPALTGTEPAQRPDINYASGGPSAQGH